MKSGAPPEVLVLLATYNGEAWLEEQLLTIFAQRNVKVRVVASDDGSADRSTALLERSAPAHDLRLLQSRSSTGSAAGNFRRLIQEAPLDRADFIAYADQDDVWDADKLHRAVLALEESGAAGYSSRVRAVWPGGRILTVGPSSKSLPGDFLFEGAGQGCTFVMRRAAFKRVRHAIERHAELAERMEFHDWMTYVVFRTGGEPWVFDPEPSLDYRQHEGNSLGSRGGWGPARRRLSLLRNGWFQGQMDAAYDMAKTIDPELPELARFLRARRSGGLAWLRYLATRSRRRRFDRAVLVAAAFAGWLR